MAAVADPGPGKIFPGYSDSELVVFPLFDFEEIAAARLVVADHGFQMFFPVFEFVGSDQGIVVFRLSAAGRDSQMFFPVFESADPDQEIVVFRLFAAGRDFQMFFLVFESLIVVFPLFDSDQGIVAFLFFAADHDSQMFFPVFDFVIVAFLLFDPDRGIVVFLLADHSDVEIVAFPFFAVDHDPGRVFPVSDHFFQGIVACLPVDHFELKSCLSSEYPGFRKAFLFFRHYLSARHYWFDLFACMFQNFAEHFFLISC